MSRKFKCICENCKFWNIKTKKCKSSLSPLYGEEVDAHDTCQVQFMIYKKRKKKKNYLLSNL